MFYDKKFFPPVQTNETLFMNIVSGIVVGIFILILLILKLVSYNLNKKAFYSQIKIYKNETMSAQLTNIANLLCKSTVMLFVNMFITYIFIHVTVFFIIDTLQLTGLDNYLYEILEKLFLHTLIISIIVISSQILILTFYKQFSPKADFIRQFRNWELVTVLTSLIVLVFLTFKKMFIKIDFNSLGEVVEIVKCYDKKSQIALIYLFFLMLEAGTRFVRTDKNVLFNTQLEPKQKNLTHLYIQLILILYIIWNI